MEWTQQIGRPRAAFARTLCDALRLLVVVHRLGREMDGDARVLRGEGRARFLDHLVRRPATLAYLLIHLYASGRLPAERKEASQAVRRVLAEVPRRYRPGRRHAAWRRAPVDPRRLHSFEPELHHPWDDALGHLLARDLLRLKTPSVGSHTDVEFRLTSAGRRLLDDEIYPRHADAARHRRICGVMADLGLHEPVGEPRTMLRDAEAHLRGMRDELAVPPERDPARELFQATFREGL